MDDGSCETCLVWLNNMNFKNIVWFFKAISYFVLLHNYSVTNANIKILYTVTKMLHKNMAKNKIKIVKKKYPPEENFVMELLSIT